jgi:hypothetical protein
MWKKIGDFLASLDGAATSLFLPAGQAKGVPVTMATLAGRLLIFGVAVSVVYLVIGLFNPAVKSTLIVGFDKPISGVVYALPRTELQVDLTFRISGCNLIPTSDKTNPLKIVLAVDYSFSVVSRTFPDTRAQYALDDGLQGPIASGKFSSTLDENAVLRTVGISVPSAVGEAQQLLTSVKDISSGFASAEISKNAPLSAVDEECAGLRSRTVRTGPVRMWPRPRRPTIKARLVAELRCHRGYLQPSRG